MSSDTATLDNIRSTIEKRGVEFIFAQFVDLYGRPSAKLIPAGNLDALVEEGAGFAGFAAGEIGQLPSDPDIAAMPDLASFTLVPWQQNLARFACDVTVEGEAWPYCPRTILKGMQGGTAATQDVFIEHVGIPTLPATRIAADALQELGLHRQVQLVVSGGIRSGADVAKALALGADAVSIGTAALVAMGDNAPEHDDAYREIGSAAGFYDDWHVVPPGRREIALTLSPK